MFEDLTEGLSPQEDEILCCILKKWADAGGGRFSPKVLNWLAYAIPQPAIETIVFRLYDGKVQVLLLPRPPRDIIWEGMLNSPGQLLRRMDFLREDGNPINGAFQRIQHEELKCNFVGDPIFVGVLPQLSKRGPDVVQCYLAQIPDDSTVSEGSEWLDVGGLGENPRVIKSELGPIKFALKQFKSTHGLS
ncbi:hypothetical protein KKC62_02285 [Patescibacteria group bacterium]|nr:hypothetical protein [Patescibacteria group bacterium]MBU1953008.1 hypothetical protein [Patescibacteria group bacterium]